MRKILHIDMDAFYASVEQRDNPALAGLPVAVGGSERRGVVTTASYEARRYGVRSAMSGAKAARLCPDLIFVKPRFEAYREVSRQIREIFHRWTDLVEPLSLDEAYLDVTEPKAGPPSGTIIARQIKRQILEETALTASAGVSFNKFLAKTASGMNKPDGLTVVLPEEADAFISALPIERFHGVGQVTARRMREIGIASGADLRERSEEELVRHFGRAGRYFHRIAHALDDRPVVSERRRRSVGVERTSFEDIVAKELLIERLRSIATELARRMAKEGTTGRTLTLKIRFHDFTTLTRSRTFATPTSDREALLSAGRELLFSSDLPRRPTRLLGLSMTNLVAAGEYHDEQLRITFPTTVIMHPLARGEEQS